MPPKVNINLQPNLQPLDLEGNTTNISHKWSSWLRQFKLYLVAAGLDDEEDKRKVALLLSLIGQQALLVFNSFDKDPDVIAYDALVKLFADHFTPKKNITVERHKFLTRYQATGESIDEYVTELKNLSLTCELGTLRDSLVKDVLICGLNKSNFHMKERLLQEDKLTLERAIELCKSMELTQSRAQAIQLQSNDSNIHAVRTDVSRHRGPKSTSKSGSIHYYSTSQGHSTSGHQMSQKQRGRSNSPHRRSPSRSPTRTQSICTKCGQVHRFKCPAEGKVCIKCNKLNHFAKMCRSHSIKMLNIQNTPSQDNDDYFVCKLTSTDNTKESDWFIDMLVNNVLVKCQLDTGAQTNCMSLKQFNNLKINKSIIKPSSTKIMSFCGNEVPNCGFCVLPCTVNNKTVQIPFNIIDLSCPTILGLRICQQLQLVKRIQTINIGCNHITDKYQHVFKGLGCLSTQCKLSLKPNSQPVIDPPRKLPFKLYPRVKVELERMEKDGVICRVSEPSEWVSSMIVTEKKSGALRICLDPRNLNKALLRSHYQLPTLEVIRSKLNGSVIFSTLDANSGFWVIPVDKESSKLLTFNTPFGRYQFKRLPFGISVAPEIFHRVMTECFGDLPGVCIYLDDLLVYGETQKSHDERLEAVLKRASEVNIKFNNSKCNFGVNQVKYMGQIFSSEGMSPDKSRIKAICEMPPPTDKKALQRFLGMITYLASYIPNLSHETEYLRNLIKKESLWQWDSHHQQAFNKLKQLITEAPVLSHFNVNMPIVLSVDASKSAVGAALLQNQKPVAYASKTLTPCQQGYAQIEKELYAVVFGCVKFRQYIYGQSITIESDHSPLVTICKKSLAAVPCRLQRMLLQIQSYDFNVKYTPGKYMYVADTLSRAPLPEMEQYLDEDIAIHVNLITSTLAVSPQTLSEIKTATLSDETLTTLKKYCSEGWPKEKSLVIESAKPFWSYREEINVLDDLVYRNTSIIIPMKLRPNILKKIHTSHMGVERTKCFVRGVLFWPHMAMEIKHMIEQCSTCLKYKPQNKDEPLLPHELPTLPWQKISADFMDFDSKKYIVITDYYSKYIEMAMLSSTNAKNVISHLKSIFSRHGIPSQLVTDGGPPFSSNEFSNFIQDWDIEHIKSSPYFPRSNGMAESGVKIIKNLLRKCQDSGTDPYLALLHLRNTPKGEMSSPAQLLMSRRLRCTVPIHQKLLRPKVENASAHMKISFKNQTKSKQYFNRKTKPLSVLHNGDNVYFKHTPTSHWSPGIIVELYGPRSYIVKSREGIEYRRNRKHILTHPPPILKDTKLSKNEITEFSYFPNYSYNSYQFSPERDQSTPNTDKVSSPTNLKNTENSNSQTTNEYRSQRGRIVRPPQRLNFS